MRKYTCTFRRVAYHRPKTPAPKNGWLLGELARLTDLPETTLRYYLQRRVIEPMEIRGTASRYDRHNLLRLLGVMRLKVEEDSTIAEKKRKLDAMGQEELERWLCGGPLPKAAAAALGIESLVTVQPQCSISASAFGSSTIVNSTVLTTTQSVYAPQSAAAERWERIALLPGLDLMVRADAREPARLVAQRICEVYSVK